MRLSTGFIVFASAIGAITLAGIALQVPFGLIAVAVSLFVGAFLVLEGRVRLRSLVMLKVIAILVATWLIALGANTLNLGFEATLLVFALVLVGFRLFMRRSLSQLGAYLTYTHRIMHGQAAQIIEELQGRDDLTPAQLVGLSGAHVWLGHGLLAERYARRALELRPLRTIPPASDDERKMDDMQVLVLADALALQGRYVEAIAETSRLDDRTPFPALITIIKAFWALCQTDDDQARQLVASMPDTTTARGLRATISPNYQFMRYYMQHRLLGLDRRDDLRTLQDEGAYWRREAERNAANPYGQRLRDILADIDEIIR